MLTWLLIEPKASLRRLLTNCISKRSQWGYAQDLVGLRMTYPYSLEFLAEQTAATPEPLSNGEVALECASPPFDAKWRAFRARARAADLADPSPALVLEAQSLAKGTA